MSDKKLLVITASNGENLKLAERFVVEGKKLNYSCQLLDLTETKNDLPLFNPRHNSKDNAPANLQSINLQMKNHSHWVICAPEYNGGSPPILTNAITWVSLTTKNWRDCFIGKIALIGTNSGGDGLRFLASFRSQLEYLGTIVVPKTISVNDKKKFNQDSAKRSIHSLIDLL